MTQDPTTQPNISAAIQAAVEQEKRFGEVEKTVGALALQQTHFFERYVEDKAAQEKRDDNILSTLREVVGEVKKTNGSVAAVVARQGVLEALQSEQAGDIEELSAGLQAQHAQAAANMAEVETLKATAASQVLAMTGAQSAIAAMQKASSDGGIRAKAFWDTLSTEYKILIGLSVASGAVIALIANISTVVKIFH